MHSAGDIVVLPIVELFSSFASIATGGNAIAVSAAAMKGGENTVVKQAAAINGLNQAALDTFCASEHTVIDDPRLT
jgi:hypothetical protein